MIAWVDVLFVVRLDMKIHENSQNTSTKHGEGYQLKEYYDQESTEAYHVIAWVDVLFVARLDVSFFLTLDDRAMARVLHIIFLKIQRCIMSKQYSTQFF